MLQDVFRTNLLCIIVVYAVYSFSNCVCMYLFITVELHIYVWEYRQAFIHTHSWCCLALDNIISWVHTSPPPLPSLNTPSILGSRAGLKGGESVGVKGTGTGERRAGKNWFSSGPSGAVCSPALCERVGLTERHSVWGNLQFYSLSFPCC